MLRNNLLIHTSGILKLRIPLFIRIPIGLTLVWNLVYDDGTLVVPNGSLESIKVVSNR